MVNARRGKNRLAPRRPTYKRMFLKEWLVLLEKEQRDVARGTGISESQISLIANGERQYTQRTLEKIAHYLGIEEIALLRMPPARWDDLPIDERRRVAQFLAVTRASSN